MAQSVDRLPQLADRLDAVFRFEAPAEPLDASLATALAEELAAAPRMTDKDAFRAIANRVKDRTGLKGKNLFHPIRVILTGAHEGPELDLIVPGDRSRRRPRRPCARQSAAASAPSTVSHDRFLSPSARSPDSPASPIPIPDP